MTPVAPVLKTSLVRARSIVLFLATTKDVNIVVDVFAELQSIGVVAYVTKR